MFRKIFWINLGLFIIVVLLSYNLYRVWSQILEEIKAPPVQLSAIEQSRKVAKEEEKEEKLDYRPSSQMSYTSITEKDLFRPEREEWQPPPPPEEEEVDLKQTSPYPQLPGQQPQQEMKEPTVHGIIIIGESKKYAIMQGWTREEPKERTRKIRLGNGQIREVPLPPVPGKLSQDSIKAFKIGDYVSESQVVDILADKVVLEKEDGERFDILLREPARLEMWKPTTQEEQQMPGQTFPPGQEDQYPVIPGGQPYPAPQGIPIYPPYVPMYPPPGVVRPGFVPPGGGAGVVPRQPIRPNVSNIQQQPSNLQRQPVFPPGGRFPFPGQSFPGQTN